MTDKVIETKNPCIWTVCNDVRWTWASVRTYFWSRRSLKIVKYKSSVAFIAREMYSLTFDVDSCYKTPPSPLPCCHGNAYFKSHWLLHGSHENAPTDLWPRLLRSVKGGGIRNPRLILTLIIFSSKNTCEFHKKCNHVDYVDSQYYIRCMFYNLIKKSLNWRSNR
jgi:hypothetical protein